MYDDDVLAALVATDRILEPGECATLASRAAALIDAGALPRTGPVTSILLWADENTSGWLDAEWERRDTGYHDHDGSAVGVYVIDGNVTNEGLPVAGVRRVSHYGPGESFHFPGTGIHRMDHEEGAITIHVYSPPLNAIGYYEIVDGLLQRTPGPADLPSPASPQLLELLAGIAPRASAAL
jgi:hypothetical protein